MSSESLESKRLRQNVRMLVVRLRVLDTEDLTSYQLPDEVITYVNVRRPPPDDSVFYQLDCPLVVLEQVNSLIDKLWLQEIQNCLCE